MRFPTVSCVPVAIRLPAAFVVIIELGENVVALNTCDARVDVDTVLTCPFDPVYAYPCDRADRLNGPLNVDEAVEKRPLNPMTVPVALYPTFEVNGNVLKLASLVSWDVLMVDVPNE